jgi:hypothetical protein
MWVATTMWPQRTSAPSAVPTRSSESRERTCIARVFSKTRTPEPASESETPRHHAAGSNWACSSRRTAAATSNGRSVSCVSVTSRPA